MHLFLFAALSATHAQDVAPKSEPVPETVERVSNINLVIAPTPTFDFLPDRPELQEDCEKVRVHWDEQGVPEDRGFALCGETALKRKIAKMLYETTAGAEVVTVFWAGHAVEIDDVVYLVPSDGFDPGLETKESLIGLDDGELASMLHPDVQSVVFYVDTVNNNSHDPILVGLDKARMDIGFNTSSALYYVPTKADDPGSTLLDGTSMCWQSDEVRPYSTDTDPGDRLRASEFNACLVQASKDPANDWSRRIDTMGMWVLHGSEMDPTLHDYDEKHVRSGPVLGRKVWVGIGGYGLAGVSLVGGVLAHGQYNVYSAQQEQLPFQGTPSERTEAGINANNAMMRRNTAYAGAAGIAVLTTGYLLWQAKKGNEQEVAVGATARPLSFWVAANFASQQPSTAGFTYRF